MSYPQQPAAMYPQQPQPPQPKKRKKWPWIVGGFVLIVFLFAAANGQETTTPSAESGTEAKSAGKQKSPEAEQSNAGGVTRLEFGETHTWSGGEAITVSAPEEYTPSNQFLQAPEGKRFVALDVTIANKGDDEYNAMSTKLTAQHNGQVAQQNYAAGDTLPDVELPPGGSTTFTSVYEIGEEAGKLQISVQPNPFAAETVYFSGQF
ncbi:uncharacterized protein DUF4352 [Halopolyspora algeriensis]|uniref:Uncharacterized protein DUF4352 n=1 Tax=Halopolyspora algeriensis TaxID=1500506 RepID=A0A368W1I4_9ACTN|nr:DUF4352 domain-containing protein [Halopolyspora algeriensis]RCW45858.1 uncharacterized protein DUF4352 [Halopolyspora algeriensis]TQM55273.1 uncharacterized protein DUF4352 [Halopolyspora algeriensis]